MYVNVCIAAIISHIWLHVFPISFLRKVTVSINSTIYGMCLCLLSCILYRLLEDVMTVISSIWPTIQRHSNSRMSFYNIFKMAISFTEDLL